MSLHPTVAVTSNSGPTPVQRRPIYASMPSAESGASLGLGARTFSSGASSGNGCGKVATNNKTTSSTSSTAVGTPVTASPPIESVTLSQNALHMLGSSVCRALVDKDYQTKKRAAQGIEDMIRFFQEKEIGLAKERTIGIINLLVHEFLCKDHRDAQIGGAVALVGTARGLQENIKYYLSAIVKPILQTCSTSKEVIVQYYTAEVGISNPILSSYQ